MLQLLLMTDVTDTQTVPAVQPTLTAASGVMTRNASQQTVTAARSVLRTDGESPTRCVSPLTIFLLCTKETALHIENEVCGVQSDDLETS